MQFGDGYCSLLYVKVVRFVCLFTIIGHYLDSLRCSDLTDICVAVAVCVGINSGGGIERNVHADERFSSGLETVPI